MVEEPEVVPGTADEFQKYVVDSFAKGSARMNRMEEAIRANTASTQEVQNDTKELLEVFKAVKGGFRVLGWIGAAAKWLGGIAAAGTAIYAAGQMVMKFFSK